MTLYAALTAGDPAAAALVDPDGGTVAFGRLAEWTDPWARALATPGKALVVCLAGRNPATVRCWLAAVRLGHAVAMLDAGMPAAARDRFLAAYEPDLLACCDGDVPPPPGYGPAGPVPGGTLWRRLTPAAGEPHPDLALVLSTSGTTGNPKTVRLSYGNVAANARGIAASLGLTGADRSATALPLHFGYGLSVVASHLIAGAGVAVLPDPPTGRAFWRRFVATGCTGFPGVAPTYELLARMLPELDRVPALRLMTSSGSRLRDEVVLRYADWLDRRGGRLFMMYGQTESTSRMTCLHPRHLPERVGSVGTAIPGGSLEIVHPQGGSGDIVYTGPNVMLGYAEGRADLALGDVTGGVLATGDLGRLDGGFLYLTGRRKRIAKVLGLRISLDDVERLFEDAGVTAAVDGGDRVLLFTDGPTDRLESARGPVAAELGIPASLVTVRRVAALPRTATGKLDYRALPAS